MRNAVMRIGPVVRILLWAVPRIRPGHRRSPGEEVLGREYGAQRLMEDSSRVHLMLPLISTLRRSRRCPKAGGKWCVLLAALGETLEYGMGRY